MVPDLFYVLNFHLKFKDPHKIALAQHITRFERIVFPRLLFVFV
jgi:hypothetical protein